MDSFIDYLKTGKSTQATSLIEKTLRNKVKQALVEERSVVASDVYGGLEDVDSGVISEAKVEHTVPYLGKWNMSAGGIGGAGKNSYSHVLDDGKDSEGKSKGPTAQTRYYINPVSNKQGHFHGYQVGAWSPEAGHTHKHLGTVRDPRTGVKLARVHHDHFFGSKINEAIVNPNSSKQGYDEDHKKNPHHATILKHGYEYSHSTPVVHADGESRIHHTYELKKNRDYKASVYPRKDGYGFFAGHTWDVSKSGSGHTYSGRGDEALDKHLKSHVKRVTAKPVSEGVEEHEKFKDPAQNPFHKILTQHGFEHKETKHKQNPFAKNNPRADDTEHIYTHPKHGKSHVIVTQEHDPTVGHGGQKSKGYHFLHRHEQDNGIMSPGTGDTKGQLHRSLSSEYGVPKGMPAPALTAWEKKSPRFAPQYKMNENTKGKQ